MRRVARFLHRCRFALLIGAVTAALLSAGRVGKVALVVAGLLLIVAGLVLHHRVFAESPEADEPPDTGT